MQQGELLLQLDPADYQARLNQAQANLASAAANAGNEDLSAYYAARAMAVGVTNVAFSRDVVMLGLFLHDLGHRRVPVASGFSRMA